MSELQHGCGALPPWRGQAIQTSHQGLQKGAGEHAIEHDDSQRQADRFCIGEFYLTISYSTTFNYCPLVLNHQVSGGSFLYLASKKDNGFLSSLITSTASLSSGQFKEGQSSTAGMLCSLWPLHFSQCAVDYQIKKVGESGNA